MSILTGKPVERFLPRPEDVVFYVLIKEKTKERKWDYQLNFTQAISKMKDSVALLFTRPIENIKQYIDHLGELFLANIEIVRPDRKNPHNFRKSKRIYPMSYKIPK